MEAHLEVRKLRKAYGGFTALDDVSFAAAPGEIVALLGPSGCGKTTLLNLIAGFLMPDQGAIMVQGRDIACVAPHRRDMAMVFQNYALFPHMTIERNVAFGLKMRGTAASEASRRVQEALDLVQLGHLGKRYPKELSGGQQQRVALARALVVRPSVLLLDEPLSNLDALLRKKMREEMRQILKAAGITTVVVTHDQEEALVTADSIVLLAAGRVEQRATPRELYERPSTIFCARFMDVTNFFEGIVIAREGDVAVIDTPIGKIRAEVNSCVVGARVTVAIRPENISAESDAGENRVSGKVVSTSYHGAVRRLDIEVGEQRIVADVSVKRCAAEPGDEVTLSWAADETRMLPCAEPGKSAVPAGNVRLSESLAQ
ncbi:MAG: ABC transporter ATP-binding protein [Xanthobacteraceae bacterium]|nr:ABC transporter ATP-binding protein [Xanthobacteraceae bacterium]